MVWSVFSWILTLKPDGYTSAAAMYGYIKRLNPDHPVQYIIHKHNKAHGLSGMNKGDFEIPEGTKLLIIPDAGSNDIEELNWLVQNGVDCIALDHHHRECFDENCKAIIVNNQSSEAYTCKDFSGVGVTFEFMRALDGCYLYDYAWDFLDLMMFGNIADVMSIKAYQTRYYIERGLKAVRNKFLLALMEAQDFSTKGVWNIHNVAWYLVPILNSMLRIGSYEDREMLFRAFIETDEVFEYRKRGSAVSTEEDIYTRMARLCKNIKSKQDKMRDELQNSLKDQINPDDKVIVVISEDGDPGITGLAAMRLADYAGKPCLVLRDNGSGEFTGSGRNCKESIVADFKELINSTGCFNYAMGHSNALGVSIDADKVEEARAAFNEALENVEYDDTVYCDFIIDVYDLTYQFIKDIDDSSWVWGTGIEEPTVAIENVPLDVDYCSVMGAHADSVSFMAGGIKFCKFKCGANDPLLEFANGLMGDAATLNVVGKCSINTYKGSSTPQVIIDQYELTAQN